MIQGRRASEEQAPTSIWLDPPSAKDTQDLLVVLQTMRSGAFVVEGLPGAPHRGAFRVRSMHQPPRQGIVRPPPPRPRTPSPSPAPGSMNVAQPSGCEGLVPRESFRDPHPGYPSCRCRWDEAIAWLDASLRCGPARWTRDVEACLGALAT